jgi:hypothetical protein
MRGEALQRKGRLIVVTRMDCLRSDLSGMSDGRKLIRASNGFWDGSTGGRDLTFVGDELCRF